MMTEDVLKTSENGKLYSEHVFTNKSGDEHSIKLFRDMSSERLEEETHEEYRMRRNLVNKTIKEHKKGKVMWSPYPFGKQNKGMVFNSKNREVMHNMMQKLQEYKETEING